MHRLLCLILLVLAATFAGCGGDGLATVSGKVTLDGAPLENGEITFEAEDGTTATAGVAILAGAYSVKVPAGKKIVKITGTKVVSERPAYANDPTGPKIKETVPIVPVRYNDRSELVREVKGSETMDFELKSGN